MTLPASFENSLQKTQKWLRELRVNADLEDNEEALSVLRVVLHRLRARLPREEAVDLGAQLPNIIQGFYYESWQPSLMPLRNRAKRPFLEDVATDLDPQRNEPDRLVRDVFNLLACHCDPREISRIINQLLKISGRFGRNPRSRFATGSRQKIIPDAVARDGNEQQSG